MRRKLPAVFSSLQIADLTLELEGRTASRGGRKLELTAREFDLLEYLLQTAARSFPGNAGAGGVEAGDALHPVG